MRILHVGEFSRPSDCELWITANLAAAGHLVWRYERPVRGDLATRAREIQADVVLLHKAPEVSADDLERAREQGAKVVWWTFDWRRHSAFARWYEPLARVSDLTLATDGPQECAWWTARGCRSATLRQGAWHEIHAPDERWSHARSWTFDYDVALLGSLYTDARRELHEHLRARHGSRYLYRGLACREGEAWGVEFQRAVASAKVIVGSNWTEAVPGYWSDRVYLTTACGGAFLASRVAGLENDFVPGVEVETWGDLHELDEKIDALCGQEPARSALACCGRARTLSQHTYRHRVQKFTEIMEALHAGRL